MLNDSFRSNCCFYFSIPSFYVPPFCIRLSRQFFSPLFPHQPNNIWWYIKPLSSWPNSWLNHLLMPFVHFYVVHKPYFGRAWFTQFTTKSPDYNNILNELNSSKRNAHVHFVPLKDTMLNKFICTSCTYRQWLQQPFRTKFNLLSYKCILCSLCLGLLFMDSLQL